MNANARGVLLSLVICVLQFMQNALAVTGSQYPDSKTPYLGVYRWSIGANGGVNGNEAFARWMGLKVVWGEDFMPSDQWVNNIEGGGWQLAPWDAWKRDTRGARMIFSVPMLPGPWDRSGIAEGSGVKEPVSLQDGAKGVYNSHFKKLAENLIKTGLGDSILRLGWEFNGGWYAWRASDDPSAFAAYWRQIVKTMRAIPGGQNLRFCWNPALGRLSFPAEKAWPGDDYVDYVGLDVYDESWAPGTYPIPSSATPQMINAIHQKVWNDVILNGDHGLKFWSVFASQHHKPFAIPEWGVSDRADGHGGMDDPFFIRKMGDFIYDPSNHVSFDCYFDVQAGDGHHQLSPGVSGKEKTEFPKSAMLFRKLFGKNSGDSKK